MTPDPKQIRATLILLAILAVMLVLLRPLRGAERPFELWVGIGNTGYEVGSTHSELKRLGWPAYVKTYIQPTLDWAPRGTPLGVHHAFGQSTPDMEIDSYDFAKAMTDTLTGSPGWLTKDFEAAWKPICAERPVVFYVGSVGGFDDDTPRLTNLSPSELKKAIIRNLQPYKNSGAAGVVIDNSCEAISYYYKSDATRPDGSPLLEVHRSPYDLLALHVADRMFPKRLTGIEAAPRRFYAWQSLQERDVWMYESHYQAWHGSKRNASADEQGYGKLDYLKRPPRRIVLQGDAGITTPVQHIEAVKRIWADNHIPVVFADPLVHSNIPFADLLK